MAQAIQLLTGKVKYTAGTPKDYGHGLRVNCVIILDDGTEEKLWASADDQAVLSLKKGQVVQLVRDAKGLKLVQQQEQTPQQLQSEAAQNQPEQWSDWTPDEKRNLAAKIQAHAKLFRYCLEQTRENCSEFCETSEDLRAIATTLFLQAVKR